MVSGSLSFALEQNFFQSKIGTPYFEMAVSGDLLQFFFHELNQPDKQANKFNQGPRWVRFMKKKCQKSCDTATLRRVSILSKYIFVV